MKPSPAVRYVLNQKRFLLFEELAQTDAAGLHLGSLRLVDGRLSILVVLVVHLVKRVFGCLHESPKHAKTSSFLGQKWGPHQS
jgi:hypothetical protein